MSDAPPEHSQDVLDRPVRLLAMGGSTRPESTTERALAMVAQAARTAGADVEVICGRELMLPIYDTETSDRVDGAVRLVNAVRRADGLVIVSPGYHGAISGLIKNALDYFEDLVNDPRPYLHGMAVGCVAVADGWQAAVTTLHQIRQVAHALRGWPTPLGVAVNSGADRLLSADTHDARQLHMVGEQVVQFARMYRLVEGA
ncbi:MAG: NAD(P)H-dependent oxidoreductase [Candidatus Nanopelagicales bacterium]|jgi:FMN reductase